MATTITPTIVSLNTKVVLAPQPSQLQQSGAIISVGGTTLATNGYQYCGSLSAVTALLSSTGNFAELTDMATTFFAQGNLVGLYVLELGANAVVVDQVSALSTWIADNPGIFYAYLHPADWDTDAVNVGSATITAGGSGYTTAPMVTFSAPTGTNGVTATGTAVISTGGAVTGITITNPGAYPDQPAPTITIAAPSSGTTATATANLVNTAETLIGNNTNPTSITYFFVTTSSTTFSQYAANKAMWGVAPSPLAPSTEFTAAAWFYNWLVNNPNASNKLAPMQYRTLYGVTPWPASGSSAEINTLLTANVNLVLTGAEGGLSTAAIFPGRVMSGDQGSAWFGMDWLQIQEKRTLAAAIIDGSNSNPPLLYDQDGINTLESIAQNIANNGVTFGCILSGVVSAIPFYTYSQQNPTDYNAGIYNGLSCDATFQNGFDSITFNIEAIQFAA